MLQAVRIVTLERMSHKIQSQVRDGRLLVRLVPASRHDHCDIHARHNAQRAVSHVIQRLRQSIGVEPHGNYMDSIPAVVNVQLRLHEVSWMQRSFHSIGPAVENKKAT